MPTYRLSIVNEHYSDTADLKANDMMSAWKEAIASAIHIAADQVSHGAPFFGAEVRLEEDDKLVGRYIVSVGATPLKD
ncbi:MAG TPA: hypothetical protein VF637_18240 [Sphingomicrobium sp.]|jgi:hypothetical protein